jgi:hypothetical protein
MTRINRAYVKRLEDLIVQLDATSSALAPVSCVIRPRVRRR